MRLIDGDAFIEAMKTCLWDWETVDGIQTSTALRQVMTDIWNAPEIRMHSVLYRGTAVWKDETDIDDVYIVLRCSLCGKESPTEQAFPFCPHCGRKMIGVVKYERG